MSQKITEISVNLLPKDPFLSTALGKFLNWALYVGRYIVIFTELIVIASFAARFVLDRQLTDINNTIFQKQSVAESYGTLENDFRLAQARIKQYQQIAQNNNLADVFPLIQQIVPDNLTLTKLEVTPTYVSLTAVAATNNALNLFISNLQLSANFTNVDIKKIETQEGKTSGLQVELTAQYKNSNSTQGKK